MFSEVPLKDKYFILRWFEERGLGDPGITFPKWMAFVIPISIICMALAWVWLQICWLGLRCGKLNIVLSNTNLFKRVYGNYRLSNKKSCRS